ncbi:MAG: potassium transporter TrkG [Pseudomonadota bacterium]
MAPPTRAIPAFRLPLFALVAGFSTAAMLVPAFVASVGDQDGIARAFFYSAILIGVLVTLASIAAQSSRPFRGAATTLVGALATYIFLPVLLAVPFVEAVPDTRFINAYFEMLSCLTTTGASYYDADRLADALHLWRGIVGWIGGLMTWAIAIAILAPLDLGGFEVSSDAHIPGETLARSTGDMRAAHASDRVFRSLRTLLPIYAGLTAVLWFLLVFTGETPLVAAVHAMSTLSTSGISASEGDLGPVGSELVILIFFCFALTRRSFLSGIGAELAYRLARDRELRLAVATITLITALLFLRHWIGALGVDELGDPSAAIAALWGSFFTAMSFLTTTGFVSGAWANAQAWSGLSSPGLVLIGLCLMGGGVATTAGGIKLLRVYALYRHGQREIEKLIHPHSVAGAGRSGRKMRREGAYIAWIFFMLFVLSLAAIMVLLAATGLGFEEAMVLAIAALTTTGPLAIYGSTSAIDFAGSSDFAKSILSVAMILGRMELLVLIALVNPAFWRA